MTREELLLAVTAALALLSLIGAWLAWRCARRASAAEHRTVRTRTAAIERRQFEIERMIIERPLLVALFDEYEDLLESDRTTGVVLRSFARMHLDLYQAASDLLDEVERGRGGGLDEHLLAWDARMRGAFSGSAIMRKVLAGSEREYGAGLARRLQSAPDDATPAGVGPSMSGAEPVTRAIDAR